MSYHRWFAGLVCTTVIAACSHIAWAETVPLGASHDGFAYQFIDNNLNTGDFGEFLVAGNTEGEEPNGDPIPAEHDLQAFLRFDLSSLAPGAIVTSATLRLFAVNTNTEVGFGANPGPGANAITLDIFAATTDFTPPATEDSLTWSIRPSVEAALSATTVQSAINVPVLFDLTTLVQRWHNGTLPNFGFGLVQRDPVVQSLPGGPAFTAGAFASSDNPTEANRPVLEIEIAPAVVPEPTGIALAIFTVPALAWAARRRLTRA